VTLLRTVAVTVVATVVVTVIIAVVMVLIGRAMAIIVVAMV
jgi:hypothetical protein